MRFKSIQQPNKPFSIHIYYRITQDEITRAPCTQRCIESY